MVRVRVGHVTRWEGSKIVGTVGEEGRLNHQSTAESAAQGPSDVGVDGVLRRRHTAETPSVPPLPVDKGRK